ncbi:hypothetical protein PFTANZ_04589 [Plasmodium falciparum Tanzania (2000708)]|uniref:Uncharacterized protein n=1 Tax=Plasmodium falciparum Tanzania (2000708) TaxID=1036725 RepID=A0A024W2D3_PLAFA|nr:hypothetical protein PFTANZ_04589 [Plasmodium falciparum Tanzania (2000708)]
MKPNDNLENNMNLSIGKIDLSNIYMDILHIHETLVNHIQTIVTQVNECILDNENDKKNKIKISSKKKYFNELLNFGNKNKNKNLSSFIHIFYICLYVFCPYI